MKIVVKDQQTGEKSFLCRDGSGLYLALGTGRALHFASPAAAHRCRESNEFLALLSAGNGDVMVYIEEHRNGNR